MQMYIYVLLESTATVRGLFSLYFLNIFRFILPAQIRTYAYVYLQFS